jgi:hypothetical protein
MAFPLVTQLAASSRRKNQNLLECFEQWDNTIRGSGNGSALHTLPLMSAMVVDRGMILYQQIA